MLFASFSVLAHVMLLPTHTFSPVPIVVHSHLHPSWQCLRHFLSVFFGRTPVMTGRATSKPEEPDFFNLKSGSGTGNMFSDMKPVKPATKGGSRSGGHRRQSSVSEEESESLSSSSEHDKPVSRKSAATSRRVCVPTIACTEKGALHGVNSLLVCWCCAQQV